MKNTTMTLNDKGIVAVISVVLVLTLALGGMIGFKTEEHRAKIRSEAQEFTAEQAAMLVELQQREDEAGTGYKVYGKYRSDGKFYVCWDYTDTGWVAKSDGLAALQD